MPLYEIFSYNVTVRYKNTLCSKASFFVIITTLISLTFPLILAYRSRGFWLKNFTYYEHPDVHFKYQYLFIAETDDSDYVITCGNLRDASNLFTYFEDCFHIKVREFDYTIDNKIDEIHFTLHVNNPKLKNILHIKLFLILDYKLHGICPLHMESLIIHDHAFGLPASKHFLSANLKLEQARALPCIYNFKDTQFNYSVIQTNKLNTDDWIQDVLYKYSRRNVSTSLTNVYTSTKHGNTPVFQIQINVAISEDQIRYKPGLWQELKHFWQQYISIGVIFYYVLYRIKKYVFVNDILPTWQNSPWKKYF